MKNLPEFKALINRYDTITIEEIREAFDNPDYYQSLDYIKENLTGFGNPKTCALCVAAEHTGFSYGCPQCVWGDPFGCMEDDPKSYTAIKTSFNPESLLLAYRNRAKYMREVLMRLNIETPEQNIY